MARRRKPLPSAPAPWKAEEFLNALRGMGPVSIAGYTHAGLGIYLGGASWSLIHLGSGHRVCRLKGTLERAALLGCEVAALTDWTFLGLDGWRNTDPDLKDKLTAWAATHPREVEFMTSGRAEGDDAMANEIARARA